MSPRGLAAIIATGVAVALLAGSTSHPAGAQTSATALTGHVTSAADGPLEGVLVSARKAGTNVTVTVVSDQRGRYRFPPTKLTPGTYSLTIRAAGYELDGPVEVDLATIDLATQPMVNDLRLRPARDLAAQLTNADWMVSAPGTEQQKDSLLNCVGCHTLERIMRSSHDAAGFVQHVLPRMGKYANQSTSLHPQLRVAERQLEMRGEERERFRREQAEFLASINLSSAPRWEYALNTLPRPTGRGTRVVITEYDLPRPTIEPHDVIVDANGIAWYSNFGEQTLGKLDPRTGKVTEFPMPTLKPGFPTGALSVRFDRDGNLWFGMMYQGAIAKFDRKTEKLQTWSLPPEVNQDNTQVNMTSPLNAGVDGKIWAQNNGFAGVHRFDLASGKFETFEPFKDGPKGQNHNVYDVISDSKNNVFFTDFAQEHIGRIDAKTGKVTLFATPTPRSAPRRGMMDGQDRLWFAEYRGNRIAMFDTRTEKFQEWPAPTPWSAPYDIAYDKNGEAWTGSMLTDRILRLDPKTDQFTEYLLPRPTNIRRVFVDSSTTPVTFWVGSNHGASIIKLEPLE
jgi:virginiamycin B lyase